MEQPFRDEAFASVTASTVTLGLIGSNIVIRFYTGHSFIEAASRAIQDWVTDDRHTIWVASQEEKDILATYVEEDRITVFGGELLSFEELKAELERSVEELERILCVICTLPLGTENYVGLDCNHILHESCIHYWLCYHEIHSCPICRDSVHRLPIFDNCPLGRSDYDCPCTRS